MTENHIQLNGDCYEDEPEEIEEEEDTTLHYFGGLFRRDEQERATFFENFRKSAKCWISKPDDPSAVNLLEAHLPTVVRLSLNAPFKDVRENAANILEELKQLGHEIPKPLFEGPSSFIPKTETVSYANTSKGSQDELAKVQALYEETFLHDGRLSNMVELLGSHSSYLEAFTKTHDFLMHGNGPLPLHIRNYVAILAASRHKCSYLVTMQEQEFRKHDGDPLWLQGLQHLPAKIRNLLTVNKMLAHQAWFVKPELVKDLLTGADSWSVSELVHAVAIMAHIHALAGFTLGCGVNPEIDTPLGHTGGFKNCLLDISYCTNPALGVGGSRITSDSDFTDSGPISPVARSPTNPGVLRSRVHHFIETSFPKITEQLTNGVSKNLEDTLTDCDQQRIADQRDQQKMADSLMVKLETIKNESSSDEESQEHKNLMFEDAASSAGMDTKRPKTPVPTPVSLVHYLEDPDYEHEDFAHSSAMTLRARDYSWEDHGFPFLTRVYPDLGPLLDDKFKTAFLMTYRMLGAKVDVNTEPFRQAIWYYIHSIKGIRHDDYNYRRVNQMLDIPFKTYVRMVACFPEKATGFDFEHSMGGLENSEKVHVNILILEARLQAELIYGLRAIMTCMK